MEPECYQLKWHSFEAHMQACVATLLHSETFADVVLSTADGRHISGHRFVLAASSAYLQRLLGAGSMVAHNHLPVVVIMPPEVTYHALCVLIKYMYSGEATVPNSQLSAVLRAGDILKIRGLWKPSAHSQSSQGAPAAQASARSQQPHHLLQALHGYMRRSAREAREAREEYGVHRHFMDPTQAPQTSSARVPDVAAPTRTSRLSGELGHQDPGTPLLAPRPRGPGRPPLNASRLARRGVKDYRDSKDDLKARRREVRRRERMEFTTRASATSTVTSTTATSTTAGAEPAAAEQQQEQPVTNGLPEPHDEEIAKVAADNPETANDDDEATGQQEAAVEPASPAPVPATKREVEEDEDRLGSAAASDSDWNRTKDREWGRDRVRDSEREKDRDKERKGDRDRGRDREREKDRGKDREGERDRGREDRDADKSRRPHGGKVHKRDSESDNDLADTRTILDGIGALTSLVVGEMRIKEEPIEWDMESEVREALMDDVPAELRVKPEVLESGQLQGQLPGQQDDELMFSPLSCELCNLTFFSPADWVRHAESEHGELRRRPRRRTPKGRQSSHDSDRSGLSVSTSSERTTAGTPGPGSAASGSCSGSTSSAAGAPGSAAGSAAGSTPGRGPYAQLVCDVCNEAFASPALWARHLQTSHTDEELAVHNRANRPAGSHHGRPSSHHGSSHSSHHGSSHHGSHHGLHAKPLKSAKRCGLCSKAFLSKASLQIHRRTHTGERPFTCHRCGYGFSVKSNLVRHIRTLHMGDYSRRRHPAGRASDME